MKLTDSDLGRPDLLTPDKEASPATSDLPTEALQSDKSPRASWNCVYSLLQSIIQSSDYGRPDYMKLLEIIVTDG